MTLDPKTLPDQNRVPMYFRGFEADLYRRNPLYMIQPGSHCDQMLKWAEQHCAGKVDVTFPDHDGKIEWLFERESDVTMFVLRWR